MQTISRKGTRYGESASLQVQIKPGIASLRKPRHLAMSGLSITPASLGNSNKQSTRQSVVLARERRVVGFILFAKHGGVTSVRVFLD
jgi:hypothetical protein